MASRNNNTRRSLNSRTIRYTGSKSGSQVLGPRGRRELAGRGAVIARTKVKHSADYTGLTASLPGEMPISGDNDEGWHNEVLSAEDLTTADREQLAAIAEGRAEIESNNVSGLVGEMASDILEALQSVRIRRGRKDGRSRRDRPDKIHAQFREQIPQLAECLARWEEQRGSQGYGNVDWRKDGICERVVRVRVLDLFDLAMTDVSQYDTDTTTAQSFMKAGLIPCAPTSPSICVTIRTVELFKRLRLRSPRLSAQAFVNGLCDFQDRVSRRTLVQQFTIAFDLYLSARTKLDAMVEAKLLRDDAHWRIHNACPSCLYKANDNVKLPFDLLYAGDGNNSLCRIEKVSKEKNAAGDVVVVESIERMDSRPNQDDYFLSQEKVNEFTMDKLDKPNPNEPSVPCEDRWHNMTHDESSATWSIYKETGIFLTTCRHGFVLVCADMVRSGELAKYPLATFAAIEDALPKLSKCVGYDCGCKMDKTARRSSLKSVLENGTLRMVVGMFHGHAHNRGCQLKFLPRYIRGLGTADFEVLERFFSKSNALAPVTRHSSEFHRRQLISAYFRHVDRIETYQALSNLISNQARDALATIAQEPNLAKLMLAAGMKDTRSLPIYLAEEEAYLRTITDTPAEESISMEYATVLTNLENAEETLSKARQACMDFGPVPDETLERGRRKAQQRVQSLGDAAEHLEAKMGLATRWKKDDVGRQAAEKLVAERAYRVAVDQVESLVVSRIFELTKMNMSQTGYKLRKHIAKALQSRSQAIRNALGRYNLAARATGREELGWDEVVKYSFLAHFDILRDARADMRAKPWATASGRQAIDLFYKISRSREELTRAQNEATNLLTFMNDDEAYLRQAYLKFRDAEPALAFQIRRRYLFQRRMNHEHRKRLERLPKPLDGRRVSSVADSRRGFDLTDMNLDANQEAQILRVHRELEVEASDRGTWGLMVEEDDDDLEWEEEDTEEAVDTAVAFAAVARDA